MSKDAFLFFLVVGAASLALWVACRFPRFGPERLMTAFMHVAVTFCDAVPAGVRKFEGAVPSSCSFWKVAATVPVGEGVFYTVAADHQNCPIGAHTHNVPQADGGTMLNEMLGMMAGLGYVKMEEVPEIPRWAQTPAAIVYARLAESPLTPDVVTRRS